MVMAPQPALEIAAIVAAYRAIRRQTLALVEPLTPEDMMVQSLPEASPAKWHLAHTTWFFETFVLSEFVPGYRAPRPEFRDLFNSYYNAVGVAPAKKLRANFSRPSFEEVMAYRRQVDESIEDLMASASAEMLACVQLGLHHEQQHQELLLTDIKHALVTNPLRLTYLARPMPQAETAKKDGWLEHPGGLAEIGYAGNGFCYDNEQPRHSVYLEPFRVADGLVTVAEYLAFMDDGGYRRPELWLSAGWDAVRNYGWQAPFYWEQEPGEGWSIATLTGIRTAAEAALTPVVHVSYFEADAFARWSGHRLATEPEWEAIAAAAPIQGNLLESGHLHPVAAAGTQLFGDCWEWTNSAYLAYPGYQPVAGAIGEYNGKFMSGQMILRGGSCVTPQSHIRPSYRNYFVPETRWQFSGIRLAELI